MMEVVEQLGSSANGEVVMTREGSREIKEGLKREGDCISEF